MKTNITTKIIAILLILNCILQMPLLTNGQGVAINTTGDSPDVSAMLDVSGTNKGVLINRMTTIQRNAINLPATGLIIYNTDCNNFNYNAGTTSVPDWKPFNCINLLTTPGTISGSTNVCANQSGVTYSIAPVIGAASYNWSIPAGASITSSSNPNTSITVTFGSNSGNIFVAAFDDCGTSNSTSSQTITITPAVSSSVFTLGSISSRCQGAGTVSYSATALNSTGITYSLDAASITGGNTIVAGTGVVTYAAGWSGTTVITASAAGCSGPATSTHTVTIYTIPSAPTGTSSQSFCSGASPTVADLAATGTSIQWYAGNGSSLTTSTALVNGTHYYATQTINGCESTNRFDVTATVYTTPSAPTGTAAQSFCSVSTPTVANLAATGTAIQWYSVSSGGSTLATTTTLVNGTHYYASQTVTGCESTSRFDVTATVNTTPSAPTGTASQSFCSVSSPTVANFTATGTSIQWYSVSSGGSALATTTALSSTHYYASQTVNGCESINRFDVTATVNTTPSAPTGTAAQSFCSGSSPTIANLAATGTSIQWYSASSGGSALATTTVLINATHYYASQTVSGCESTNRFDVTATVYVASNAGTLTQTPSSGSTACQGSGVQYSCSGYVGTFNNFEYQWNGTGGAWTYWTAVNPYTWTSSLNDPSILYIRAVATNGVCPAAYSSPVNITVIPTGTVTAGGVTKTTTCSGTYSVVSFTYSSSPGTTTWTVPSGVTSVDYLVVGAGGGGSFGTSGVNYGAGGAGGTVKSGTITVSGSPTVVVGTGTLRGNGGNSVFSSITSTGGTSPTAASRTGGSNTYYSGAYYVSGYTSGGGAGGGANGSNQNGGAGASSSITGTSVTYAGGGGGGLNGVGGSGGGGNGNGSGSNDGDTSHGTNNLGGGGGGSGTSGGNGGSTGGSGIVIIKF